MKTNTLMILPVICLALSGCLQRKSTQTVKTTSAAVPLDAYFTTTAPASPAQISAVRATARAGDAVTITGLVMGREQPFVDGRAAFILGDKTVLTPCNTKPGDTCATPWDACCDTSEDKQRGTATIQLVDGDGRVLKQGLKGSNGLKELSVVTLTGTVDKASTPEALIINASQLHVTGP